MTPSGARVLIAGAGPSGLVAALALLQNNIPVRIITKELEHRLGQRGAGIRPRTSEVFHFLRVPEVHQRARKPLTIQEYKPGTLEPRATYILFPEDDPTPSIPYNGLVLIGQQMLEGILRSHLEKYCCSVELGTELLSFEDNGHHVLTSLVKRMDGKEVYETFEAPYLIGADGAKGITRKQLGLTFLGETRQDFYCVLGDLCLEIEGIGRNLWHFFGDRASDFFMLRPTDEVALDGFQFVMSAKDYEPKQLLADQTLMVKCMSEIIGHDIKIRKATALSEFRPNIRMVNKFNVGRVFVAGDAAHPIGGQGLNSSVQDSLNLAWKLTLVYKGLSPSSLLDTYTTERLPVIAEMLHITTGILNKTRSGSLHESDNMMRERRMSMLGVNYRSSPIVLDEFSAESSLGNTYGTLEEGVLVAGDRAPDATELALISVAAPPYGQVWAMNGAETETRLFDMFSPTFHTVLVFAPDLTSSTAQDVLAKLTRYPKDIVQLVVVLPQGFSSETMVTSLRHGPDIIVIVDRGGHAYPAYVVTKGETKVIVVRPDGVVGAIARGVEGLVTYFARIFL